jgi:hypothetical protein
MSKRMFLSVTIVVCFLAVVQLFAFPNALRLQVIDRYEDSGISYDSFSPLLGTHEVIVPMRASAPFMHLNPSTGLAEDLTTRSFHISMSLVARSLDGFPNAFQTAPGNAGVRLEFTPGMAALVVATNQGDWRIIPVSTSFGVNEPHTIDLTIDAQDRVVIVLDGKAVVDQVFPDLSYQISDVVIGSGFSKARPFVGEIHDASVSFQIARVRPNGDALVSDLKVALTAIILTCLYFLIGPERMARMISFRIARPPWERAPRVDAELARWPYGFALPLPNDFEATLHLSRHNVSPQDLRYLAREAERSADEGPAATATSARERSWDLPDGSVAMLRPRNGTALTDHSYRRLAQYVRDFADVLDR